MAKLVYSALASLDGFTEDAQGDFSWAAPDDEVHEFVNELERPVGTYLYGRRMYEVMVAWETLADQRPFMREFAEIWQRAEKVVFSKTLERVESDRTRIQREFDPEAVRRMKDSDSGEISIGGPELASQALATGLIDELHLFLVPVLVGSGKRALPIDEQVPLELLGQRRFGNGTIHLHYGLTQAAELAETAKYGPKSPTRQGG